MTPVPQLPHTVLLPALAHGVHLEPRKLKSLASRGRSGYREMSWNRQGKSSCLSDLGEEGSFPPTSQDYRTPGSLGLVPASDQDLSVLGHLDSPWTSSCWTLTFSGASGVCVLVSPVVQVQRLPVVRPQQSCSVF